MTHWSSRSAKRTAATHCLRKAKTKFCSRGMKWSTSSNTDIAKKEKKAFIHFRVTDVLRKNTVMIERVVRID